MFSHCPVMLSHCFSRCSYSGAFKSTSWGFFQSHGRIMRLHSVMSRGEKVAFAGGVLVSWRRYGPSGTTGAVLVRSTDIYFIGSIDGNESSRTSQRWVYPVSTCADTSGVAAAMLSLVKLCTRRLVLEGTQTLHTRMLSSHRAPSHALDGEAGP